VSHSKRDFNADGNVLLADNAPPDMNLTHATRGPREMQDARVPSGILYSFIAVSAVRPLEARGVLH
jgi:hypothetical protein